MGASLSSLLWRAAAPLYAWVDRIYRRWNRLEQVGEILFVGRTHWRGPRRRLEDGTEVQPGATILRLHLNNQLAAAAASAAGTPTGVGRRFARRFLPACTALARRLRDDADWRDVVAVQGVAWIGPYVGERFGFEFERLPGGLKTRFIRWHMASLLAVADPDGGRHAQPWPFEIWISRRRLCAQFLAERESS